MKPGARVLGIAESYTGEESTLAGVLMTATGRIDEIIFGSCTVSGTDVTDGIIDLIDRLDREDINVILIGGVALAWYNIIDIDQLEQAVTPPVIAVSFEASDGLEDAIDEAFAGDDRTDRLERYRALPPRDELTVNGVTVYVRSTSLSLTEMEEIIVVTMADQSTRPEPLRVANIAARAGDEVRA